MATPTNLPAAQTTGAVLTAAYMNDLRGAFRVLQVVTGFTTTQVTNNTTSFVDCGLTATITPQSTSSKILVYISHGAFNGAGVVQEARLLRDATTVNTFGHILLNDGSPISGYASLISFDSPAAVTALVYKTQFRRVTGANGNVFNLSDINGTQRSTIVLMEISA